MKRAALLLLLCGCTSITTTQTETRVGTNTAVRLTRVRICSFLDSSAKVSKLRTIGTEKSQGMGIGEAATEASSSNAVQIFINGAKIAEKVP